MSYSYQNRNVRFLEYFYFSRLGHFYFGITIKIWKIKNTPNTYKASGCQGQKDPLCHSRKSGNPEMINLDSASSLPVGRQVSR
jgi:hypothetical protein